MALNETVPEVILALGEGTAEKTSDFRIGTESTSVTPVRCSSHRTPSELPSELLWWQGWHLPSANVARLRRHMWIEFVGSLLCYERFFPGYSGFPSHQKPKFDLTRLDLI